jgi:hypothetical protein
VTNRRTMDSAYRGGRVDPDAPLDEKPQPLRYPCFADGCPMAGTMFPDQVMGEKSNGTCVYHYRVSPSDIPRVTRVLQDWLCVSDEINHARGVLTGPLCADAKAQDHEFAAAWNRLRALSPGWEQQLAPGTIRTSKGVDTGNRQTYSDWAKHLERFIGARVVEVLSPPRSER